MAEAVCEVCDRPGHVAGLGPVELHRGDVAAHRECVPAYWRPEAG